MTKNDFIAESREPDRQVSPDWPLSQDSRKLLDGTQNQTPATEPKALPHRPGSPHPVDVHVGTQLKKLRGHRQLSQSTLAGKLGLTFQQIQKYEGGKNRLSASRMFEIGAHLDVSPGYFFEGLDPGLTAKISGDRQRWSEDKNPYQLDNDFMTSTESIRMMSAFYRIADPDVRLSLKTLIYRVAQSYQGKMDKSDQPAS